MGDIYSDFLDELLSNIRTRSISWDAQQRSGLIDDSQVRTIKTIDKQRRENRAEIVSKVNFSLLTARNTDFALLMVNLVKRGKYADILQFTLVLLTDLLTDVKSFAEAILSHDIIDPLLRFTLSFCN